MPYRKATIRLCLPEDESVLFGLAQGVFGGERKWSDGRTLTALATDTVFVAELGSEPAGYVALERDGDSVRIEQLLVSPAHEGEGVGRQLLEYAEGWAIAEGAASLQVVVEGDNRRALDFYRGRGFAAVGDDVLELMLPQR